MRGKFVRKITNFDSLGGCIPTFLEAINVKFGTGELTCGVETVL